MDAWALNLKPSSPLWSSSNKQERPSSFPSRHWCHLRVTGGDGTVVGTLEIRVSTNYNRRTVVVQATGKKKKNNSDMTPSGDDNQSVPEGDESERSNPLIDEPKLDESTYKSRYTLLDWRDFRANLVAQQQVQVRDPDVHIQGPASVKPSNQLGLKWAHPISSLEPGCVLVATEKLDGVRSFERSVVLLLRLGTRDPKEGPFGIIINRPMLKKIKHVKPSSPYLATTFGDCPLHSGGPLDISMFLLKAHENPFLHDFEQVVPGICFGARDNIEEAASLVKNGIARPLDFRFFVGYAGWQLDQLRDEVESGYWVVAACSSHLIFGTPEKSSAGLWKEILQLMGGQYSELSRKPKHDSP